MPLQTALQNPEFLRPSSIVSMLRVMEMLKDIVSARLAIYGPDILEDRHCERSEAIHRSAKKVWIASSLRSSQ